MREGKETEFKFEHVEMFRPHLLLYSTINTKLWNNQFILLISNLIDLAEIFPLLRERDKEEKGDSSAESAAALLFVCLIHQSGINMVHHVF